MATNLPFCFSFQFLEQLLKFLVNFTLLKYVKSQRSCGFFITKELIFGFQILNLKDHFSASLTLTKLGRKAEPAYLTRNHTIALRLYDRLNSAQGNLLQLNLYSNEIYGFCTSHTGKGFSERTSTVIHFRKII